MTRRSFLSVSLNGVDMTKHCYSIRIDTTELRQAITETLTEYGLALKYPAPAELIDALKEADEAVSKWGTALAEGYGLAMDALMMRRKVEDWMRVI